MTDDERLQELVRHILHNRERDTLEVSVRLALINAYRMGADAVSRRVGGDPPREPTKAMIDAGDQECGWGGIFGEEDYPDLWKAMYDGWLRERA